jgi:predicted TIM-barrel fold metal-dependent hydrolase
MVRAYDVIDADAHVLEPLNLWERYIDPKFADQAPRVVVREDGKEALALAGKVLGSKRGIGVAGGIGARDGVVCSDTMSYSDGKPGGFDPHKRIPDMDLDGIDAAFLFPTLGLFAGAIDDPALAAAVCRAYNRWIVDYCAPYPDRLFGIGMLPLQSVELAIKEMTFIRQELGLRAASIRPNPYSEKMIYHPDYAPFWSAAEDLDLAIAFHEGAGASMVQVGSDRFSTPGARHIVVHTMEMMMAAASVIWGGVCERHPKVKIGFMESGGGWIAPWIDRMDRHFDDHDMNDSGLTIRPSELFKRNCWISYEPVEGTLGLLADYIGPENILWATDYPHPDGFFPGAPAMVQEKLAHLPAETRRQVMAGGAMAFYGLD